VYGVPKAHITDTDSLSYVCVKIDSGPCEIVDVRHAYLNAEHHHESVLLWRNDALDPSRKTHISIRLVKTWSGSISMFPFKAIHYYEQQEYSRCVQPVLQPMQSLELIRLLAPIPQSDKWRILLSPMTMKLLYTTPDVDA
jgi:hypothetical protein